MLPGVAQLVGDLAAIADDADADAVAGQLGEVLGDRDQHQPHQPGDFFGRPLPVLRREREHGQVLDAAIGAREHRAHQRIDALLVAEEARHEALLGPAAVAVHDDRHMAGNARARIGRIAQGRSKVRDDGAGTRPQTAMISASLATVRRSISAIIRSVTRCISSSERRSSSSEICLSFSSFLAWSLASRRRLRTATFESSLALRTTF